MPLCISASVFYKNIDILIPWFAKKQEQCKHFTKVNGYLLIQKCVERLFGPFVWDQPYITEKGAA